VSTGAFFSFPGLAAAAGVVIAGALVAGIRPPELLRGAKPVAVLAAFITLIRAFPFGGPGGLFPPALSAEGLAGGVHQGLCFIVSYAAGALLFSVTTMQELRDSLGRAEAGAAKGLAALRRALTGGKGRAPDPAHRAPGRFSLGLTLMLGFLPRFFELWESANLAFDARAGKKGFRRLVVLVPLVIERMMELAGQTAEALESRGALR
jgi:biotin transport system permease protein